VQGDFEMPGLSSLKLAEKVREHLRLIKNPLKPQSARLTANQRFLRAYGKDLKRIRDNYGGHSAYPPLGPPAGALAELSEGNILRWIAWHKGEMDSVANSLKKRKR